jgi:hypothetical protein
MSDETKWRSADDASWSEETGDVAAHSAETADASWSAEEQDDVTAHAADQAILDSRDAGESATKW